MAADSSGGFLRGHGVAIALVAIFAGVTLAVAYAASDGAIFGQKFGSAPAGGMPVNSSSGGAAVISRDSFDTAASTPVQNASSAPVEYNTTLSDEQRRLLAMRDFPWDSVAGGHIASTQDSMDRLRQPVPAEPAVDSLALSDRVTVNVERSRAEVEDDDLDLTEIIDDVIDIDIPIDVEDDEDQQEEEQPPEEEEQPPEEEEQPPEEEEQPPEEEEQEEPPQDDEGQGGDTDDGNQTDDGDSSGEGSGDEGSEDDESSGEGSGGNSTSSDPSEDSGSDGGNSTSSESG